MDEQAEYAVLSKAAYDFFHGGEALAQAELQEYGLGDHSIDEALSDDHAVVITRPDGSAVVSYRGTDAMSAGVARRVAFRSERHSSVVE